MDSKDIQKIEQTLNIELPVHYVEYVKNFPTLLLKLKENIGDLLFLYSDVEQLIVINQHLGFHQTDKFIKQKFCIGENGGGDFYLIDLENPENQKVYFFDHEETVEKHYHHEIDLLDWDALEYSENLKEHEKEVLEIFEL